MFNDTLIAALIAAAKKNGIEPAALLALCEVETPGAPFESADGRTPTLLYERHVAWREAAKVSKALQSAFARAGLAIPKWSRATQYKDQGTSAKRLALIARARVVDAEVATLSASWGIGQTMGFHAKELGFSSAVAMVDSMTGSLSGQIDIMIADLRNKKLIFALNRGDWVQVARVYNGAGYAQNNYDTRLADAHKRWTRRIATIADGKAVKRPSLSVEEIKAVQRQLRAAGIKSVGLIDGDWGRNTTGAISSFQEHEGLPVNGELNDETRLALDDAYPAEPSKQRTSATAADLKAAGSKIITLADRGALLAKGKVLIGGLIVGGGEAGREGFLDQAQSGLDKVNQAKTVWSGFSDLAAPMLGHPVVIVAGLMLALSGVATWLIVEAVKRHRVADHSSGAHLGVAEV